MLMSTRWPGEKQVSQVDDKGTSRLVKESWITNLPVSIISVAGPMSLKLILSTASRAFESLSDHTRVRDGGAHL